MSGFVTDVAVGAARGIVRRVTSVTADVVELDGIGANCDDVDIELSRSIHLAPQSST